MSDSAMPATTRNFCLYLRTKNGYFRSPEGRRDDRPGQFDRLLPVSADPRAPVGPDGMPCDAQPVPPNTEAASRRGVETFNGAP